MTAATAAIVASSAESATGVPQLRTILLTDLVDSTGWVERLGDGPAAELFRAHDRLVLQLQERWRGRLIDRSDGMLLLFERPIDGLGFAIDYNRGLRELGEPHGAELTARAGLHVGEVLTWRNSDEAVRVGAKPLEIEGLAKPMAARLMTMARPGQILLSAVAEPLAHRAARELGERGQHLLWKSHGRWRFKGVPQPQQIFEVGEPGIAPLRAPPSSPKAWRDIPLWRRPAALAAEAAVVAVIAVGLWFFMRPQPAIAFNERDWVVLADLRNLTGDSRYEGTLTTALRISLEQSRYVNVLSEARARDIIAATGRTPEGVVMDRTLASEVAMRGGIRAVLLPTISDAGGPVRVSLEVIDPHTQATVYAESAQGQGASSAIKSVAVVSEALRSRLGEELRQIRASSMPLAQVTTSSLDALRAYTLGQEAFARQQLDAAEQHYSQALELDPEFAMAEIGLGRVAFAKTDVGAALRHMDAALRHSERLSERERLYVSAQLSMLRWEKGYVAQWRALAKLYPDYHVALFNAAHGLYHANRYPEMRELSDRASVSVAVTRPAALYYRGLAELPLGQVDDAVTSFSQAWAAGFPNGFVEPAMPSAVRRDFKKAAEMLKEVAGPPQVAVEKRVIDMTFAADDGKWDLAAASAEAIRDSFSRPGAPFEWAARASALAVERRLLAEPEVKERARELINIASSALESSPGRARESVASAALYAGFVAAAAGDAELAERSIELAAPVADASPATVLANLTAIVRAQSDIRDGNYSEAIEQLKPFNDDAALLLTRLVRAEALDPEAIEEHAAMTQTEAWRARAYGEWAAERPPVLEALRPKQSVTASDRKRSTR
ncbi:putative peptide modification system cyclase [Novilysobacter spongiicola]|uniref:Putative peptide modification system cyclase n=1 Tax=Lysobacter spongiicola DSM 21749 TaxID=1122188 RepID=A0A1T4Q9T6_9GAMM|nr:putative peptide modification system cyclase [Lysobacter spongiicola]SKA00291.1 putative peptide modification system cyclase [Lysobacter spongiicola DSM 21749]